MTPGYKFLAWVVGMYLGLMALLIICGTIIKVSGH